MDTENLLRTVASYFETESHRLQTDDFGNPRFTLEDWFHMNHGLSLIELEKKEPLYPYTLLLEHDKWTPLIEVKDECFERWVSPLSKVSMVNLYPHIAMALSFQESVPFKEDIWILKYLVEKYAELGKHLSPTGQQCVKAWINYYYGVRGSENREFREFVINASNFLMTKIKKMLGDRYIAADTDEIYFKDWKNPMHTTAFYTELQELGFPSVIVHYEGGIFFGKKRRILHAKSGIELTGFREYKE